MADIQPPKIDGRVEEPSSFLQDPMRASLREWHDPSSRLDRSRGLDMQIEQWDEQYTSACALIDLVETYRPTTQPIPRESAVQFLRDAQGRFADSTLVMRVDGVIRGFAMLCETSRSEMVDVMGVIHPMMRRRGVGSELLNRLREVVVSDPECTHLKATGFDSTPDAKRLPDPPRLLCH